LPSAGGKIGDVPDLHQQPGGAGRPDPVQAHQRGAGGLDSGGQLLVGGLLALVDPLQVGDQLGGDPAAGLPVRIPWPDPGQQRPGPRRRQRLLRPPGIRSASSWCSWQIIRV
jgi:hypothetical protein